MSYHDQDYNGTAADRYSDPNYRPGRGRQAASPSYPSSSSSAAYPRHASASHDFAQQQPNMDQPPKTRKPLVIGGIVIDELPSSTTRIDTPSKGAVEQRRRPQFQDGGDRGSRDHSQARSVESHAAFVAPVSQVANQGWEAVPSGWATESSSGTTSWESVSAALPVVVESLPAVPAVPEFYEDRSRAKTSDVIAAKTSDSRSPRSELKETRANDAPLKVYKDTPVAASSNNNDSGWAVSDSGCGWNVEGASSGWSTGPAVTSVTVAPVATVPVTPTPVTPTPVTPTPVTPAPVPVQEVIKPTAPIVKAIPVQQETASGWAIDSSASGWDIPATGSGWTTEPVVAQQPAKPVKQHVDIPVTPPSTPAVPISTPAGPISTPAGPISTPAVPAVQVEQKAVNNNSHALDSQVEMIKCPFCSNCFGYPSQTASDPSSAQRRDSFKADSSAPKSRY